MAALTNTITVGSFSFGNDAIDSVDTISSLDLVGNELAMDELCVTISGSFSGLDQLAYGTQVTAVIGGADPVLYYLTDVLRTGPEGYVLRAVSLIGILDRQTFVGGIYGGALTLDTLPSLLASILPAGSYTLSTPTAEMIYGWLPYCTKREALQQVLAAFCLNITRSSDGRLYISRMSDSTASAIPDSRVRIGGSVGREVPASKIVVTEHTFPPDTTAAETELFSNIGTVDAAQRLVKFSAPVILSTLRTTGGLEVVESGVNYAVVSGVGGLYGVPYGHVTHNYELVLSEDAEENVISLTDCTLITYYQSADVAARLAAYYGGGQTVHASFYTDGERPGDKITLTGAYGSAVTGYIKQLDTHVSATQLADAEIRTGFAPPASRGLGNLATLTGSGTWTVPAVIRNRTDKHVRVVLIGGGQGGQGGEAGTDGETASDLTQYSSTGARGRGGRGGKGGKGGMAGLVLVMDFDCAGKTSVSYSCGVGGAGSSGTVRGGETPGAGSYGTATTFGGYSSNSGARPDGGVFDFVGGKIHGHAGVDGKDGGDGGDGGGVNNPATGDWTAPLPGGDVPGDSSGRGGSVTYGYYTSSKGVETFGGGGGGASVQNSGGDGQWSPSVTDWFRGSDGGDGGAWNVSPGRPAGYGVGGTGGFGGGGGGGGAGVYPTRGYPGHVVNGGYGGLGGIGQDGGPGSNGAVLIYY